MKRHIPLFSLNKQSFKATVAIASGLLYVGSQKEHYNKMFDTKLSEAVLLIGALFVSKKFESNLLTDDIKEKMIRLCSRSTEKMLH